MGIAAYNRGTKAIRSQIDREVQENQGSGLQDRIDGMQATIDRLKSELAAKEQELDRARRAYNLRCSEKAALKEELAELRKRSDCLSAAIERKDERIAELDRRWRVVSLILRDGLQLPDSEVEELKESVYSRNPSLKREV